MQISTVTSYIDPEKCIGCGAGIIECPAQAIVMLPGWRSNELAAETAVRTVREYLKGSEIQKIVFNVFRDYDKKYMIIY